MYPVWTFFRAREALRDRNRRRAVALVVGAIAVEAVAVALGVYQITYVTLAKLDSNEVPGTYVLLGRDARDEVVLSPDGTFVRTASYRGVTQHQHGEWRHSPGRGPADYVHFDALEPPCLRSTEAPGTTFHYREPNEVLCIRPGGGIGALLCRAGGRLAICLGDDGFEFIRSDPSNHEP
jgi:hypothetical protein